MTLEKFKDILISGSDDEKYEAITNIKLELLVKEVFNILFELLKDNDFKNRFFALYHLIDKFSSSFEDLDEPRINIVYDLLFDESGPVADRSIWALSIIGDKAIDKMKLEYQTGSLETKIRITYAIGRGDFSQRTKDRVEILLAGLNSDNEELRFTAMCEMMSNTPIGPWSESEWNSTQDPNIDFEEIYDLILPIAISFSESIRDDYKEFSKRYIDWIKKAYNNT